MALVLFRRYHTPEVATLPVVDGQLIWDIDTGDTYIDVGTQRIPTGGGSYRLPIASETVLGGIKSGGDIVVDTSTGIVSVKDDSHLHTIDNIKNLQNVLDLKASLDSPNFTGTPKINGVKIVSDENYIHTDNNFTTLEKTKLSNIENNAQVNKIEDIKVNGISLSITDKSVSITVPQKLSELTNDVGFVTNTVNNLTNYYLKSEINDMLSNLHTLDVQVVQQLPTENISTTTIYLLPHTPATENNYYDEYIYVNNKWELIGNTQVDFSGYLKTNGDGKDVTVTFTESTNTESISSGESLSVMFGKIKKLFARVLPSGGTTGQILVKKSNTDFDAEWQNNTGELALPEDLVYFENGTDINTNTGIIADDSIMLGGKPSEYYDSNIDINDTEILNIPYSNSFDYIDSNYIGNTLVKKATLIFSTNSITTTGVDFSGFKVDDVVSITNCINNISNNKVAKITAVTAKVLTFENNTFISGIETETATITKISNIVSNGNFANGTTGWRGQLSTLSTTNNILSITGNGAGKIPIAINTTSVNASNGRKVFAKAKLKATNSLCSKIQIVADCPTGTSKALESITSPVQNMTYSLNGVFTTDDTYSGSVRIWCWHEYADATTANGKVMEAQEVIAIDMGTDASNPLYNKTKEEMDALFTNFTDETPASYSIAISSDNPATIESVGECNLFDGIMEQGNISSSGELTPATTNIRSVNYTKVIPNVNYCLSESGSFTSKFIACYDKNKNFIERIATSSKFVTSNNCYFVKFMYYYTSNITPTSITNIQFNYGLTSQIYTPYGSTKLAVCGKNLVNFDKIKSVSYSGVTITNNNDGSFTINGTATGYVGTEYRMYLPKGTYCVNTLGGNNNANFCARVYEDNGKYKDYVRGLSFTLTEVKQVRMLVQAEINTTYNNDTFYPIVSIGNTPIQYEAYIGTEYTLPLKDMQGNMIPLRKIADAKDVLFKDVDGLWKIRKNVGSVTFNGISTENWVQGSASNSTYKIFAISSALYAIGVKDTKQVIGDNFKGLDSTNASYSYDEEGICLNTDGNQIRIWIHTNRLTTQDANGFKTWLSQNPTTVFYPTTTTSIITLSQDSQTVLNELTKPLDGNTILYGINKVNPLITGIYYRGSKNSQMLDGKTADYFAKQSDVQDNANKIGILNDKIDNGVTQSPTVNLGMNNAIRKTDGVTSIPKFVVNGKDCVNLLGKDGNCEDVSKWSENGADIALDISSKVFGTSSIKVTSNGTYTWGGTRMYTMLPLINSKHYLITGYIRNINTSKGAYLYLETVNGGTGSQTPIITSTDKFIRVACTVSPLQLGESVHSNLHLFISSDKGQSANFDGIMINEITADEYNNLSVDQLMEKYPYIDSYACLENPYIEIKHDNLVRNGNGEEGLGWWIPYDSNFIISKIDNGFKIVSDTTWKFCKQLVKVKPNTTYYLSGNTSGVAKLYAFGADTATMLRDGVGNFSTSTWTEIYIYVVSISAGTGYADSIMLIEGTTAPTEYKPCRIERCVIEGKFTSDDTIVYENGEVSGLLNWKHKTLYGKDYDWIYHGNYTGYKAIKIANFDRLATFSSPLTNTIGIKYDGKILTTQSVVAGTDGIYHGSDYYLYTTLSDSDTGWTEAINPNADEVKAFMNGWRAVNNLSNKYTAWVSIVDGNVPSGTPHTTLTVAYTAGATSINVASTTGFALGDKICIQNATGGYNYRGITAISNNVITIDLGLPSAGGIIGYNVFKCDDATNTSLLTFCKNNVAPGYEGYRIHYKLKNPEPITDVNTHIHGVIPKLDNGDNYLYLDYGIVIRETVNPSPGATGDYKINKDSITSTAQNTECKNKVEMFYAIYRNRIFDNNWTDDFGTAYGNISKSCISSNYDINATYTVDYQILKTLHTSPTLVQMSYQQNILSAIDDLAETVENKQKHDTALDTLTDLSIYERINNTGGEYCGLFHGYNVLFAQLLIPIVHKKCKPITNLRRYKIIMGNGISAVDITKDFYLDLVRFNSSSAMIQFATSNQSIIPDIKTYGVQINVDVEFDCRGRI